MPRYKSRARRAPKSHPRGIVKLRRGGYAFVSTPEGEFYIPESNLEGAVGGDMVEIAPISAKRGKSRESSTGSSSSNGRPAARVLRVVERANETLIGRYEVADPFGVVVPLNPMFRHDIFTMRAENPDIPDGALVRVRITTHPSRNTAATGVIEEVLDDSVGARSPIDLIVARHKLETAFSEASLAEARTASVDSTGAFAEGYRDLRDRFVVTVDPADASDFDDAISFCRADACELEENCPAGVPANWTYLVGVHIADVSHYVPWNSSLDLEARRRGTSVYLVDRVIPMLPEELSNDVCSLKPNEERRSFTVDMYLDEAGRVVGADFYRAIIESKRRLSYDEALGLLEDFKRNETDFEESDGPCGHDSLESPGRLGKSESSRGLEDSLLRELLEGLSKIARLRAADRARRGGLDFETDEAKVRLDEEGAPLSVELRRKNAATELIEEAMIMANETVADYLVGRKWPAIFRVHEAPDLRELASLVPILSEFSWWSRINRYAFEAANPHAIQAILEEAKGRKEEALVNTLLLRAQKRAVYRASCEGHYGLASEAYLHFTSPIRRYPDLVVHRMLAQALTKRIGTYEAEVNSLDWIARHSSEMERIADEAAAESQEYKILEYLQDFAGERFEGVVSGVMSFGLFVRLENTAEGLIPIADLGNEFFSFDGQRQMLVGEDSGESYRLGQALSVVLRESEPDTRTLRFSL